MIVIVIISSAPRRFCCGLVELPNCCDNVLIKRKKIENSVKIEDRKVHQIFTRYLHFELYLAGFSDTYEKTRNPVPARVCEYYRDLAKMLKKGWIVLRSRGSEVQLLSGTPLF
ncbi:hypothetical protein CCP2SC5_1020007 [Azospirillaceae bacterium]